MASGHQVLAAIKVAAGDLQGITVPDPGAGGEIEVSHNGFIKCVIDGSGSPTISMADEGFLALVTNSAGSGSIDLQDSDGASIAAIATKETALVLRVGEDSTNLRWAANIMGMGATATP